MSFRIAAIAISSYLMGVPLVEEAAAQPFLKEEQKMIEKNNTGQDGIERERVVADFKNEDGTLKVVRWAESDGTSMFVDGTKELSSNMAHSIATGVGTVSNGLLGADLIRLRGGTGFKPHVHPGDHLLIVVSGTGTITYDGHIYETKIGEIYLVEGSIAHAVGAITDHVILAVGAPHRPVDSTDRMKPVAYDEVLAEIGDMKCLIDQTTSANPNRLHDSGTCSHCPCGECPPDSISPGFSV